MYKNTVKIVKLSRVMNRKREELTEAKQLSN